MKLKLSLRQKESLVMTIIATKAERWYRAQSSGERVTLASLYRLGLLVRRAWRGASGEADAAYEYQAIAMVVEVYDEMKFSWQAPAPGGG